MRGPTLIILWVSIMKFKTTDQALDWAKTNGYKLDSQGLPAMQSQSQLAIPSDAGKRTWLCRSIWGDFTKDDSLLWHTQWGIWPSGEHPPLYSRLRSSLGCTASLTEIPAQVVNSTESEDGLSLLLCGALFLWDTWLLSANANRWVFFSHDEYVRYDGLSNDLTASIKQNA